MFGFGKHKAEMPIHDDAEVGGGNPTPKPKENEDRNYAIDPETGMVIMGEPGQSEREVAEEARHDLGKE